jgi:hypothetical protein
VGRERARVSQGFFHHPSSMALFFSFYERNFRSATR